MEEGGVKIEEIQGRGRAVVAASHPLKAGEIILRDSSILLYSARPLSSFPVLQQQQHQNNYYCSHCFTIISPSSSLVSPCCPSCFQEQDDDNNNNKVLFCSPNCLSTATATSHTPWVCHALLRLRHALSQNPDQQLQLQARFLVAAYNLAIVCPSHFQTLLSLQGDSGQQGVADSAVLLHSLISSLCPPPPPLTTSNSFCLDVTAALLAKDKLNAFGLMEPPFTAADGGVLGTNRSVRAYGIYPNASLFNHDCLPNACRFDYIDRTPTTTTTNSSCGSNTDIIIRMIHDVPQGREICLSYFPVNLNYRDRQLRLKDDYGFICSCDRCLVEANWSSSDDDDDREEELMDEVAMDEDDGDELMEAGEDKDGNNMVREGDENGNDFPHAYFFLRYVCTRQNCWGTLAPLPTPPSSNGTTAQSASGVMMECNVCGSLTNDEQEETDADACLP